MIKVIYMNMPESVKGYIVKMFDDGEDYYTVVLNPKYNWEQQQATYRHELKHIDARDLERFGDVNELELIRHE